jgi:hypothetical protein
MKRGSVLTVLSTVVMLIALPLLDRGCSNNNRSFYAMR